VLSVLGAGLVVVATLDGCGGSSSRGNVVVQIGAMEITKETLNHYMNVAWPSTGPAPASLVPPAYTACIAELRAIETEPGGSRVAANAAQLKSKCERMYAEKEFEVLHYLISSDWVIGEAADLGVRVSEDEVSKELGTLKQEQFPHESGYRQFLARSGHTEGDVRASVRLMLLARKSRAVPGAGARFGQGYQRRWRAVTNCHPGYIVRDCRQYKGSTLTPE
jgi:hypothetical protein